MEKDHDYDWLLSHLQLPELLQPRLDLAGKVGDFLKAKIQSGSLPYTVGVFGGWGSGKTTFLALLATKLETEQNCRVVYFNSWKYAGFMEIVPSLIYKMMQYGVIATDENRNKAAMRVLLSLGKEYSDKFGEWAEKRVGVNPVKLFKDAHHLVDVVGEAKAAVRPELVQAYYTQVDKAQDALNEVFGTVVRGSAPKNTVIVLIDELDRCDPDEAFEVIKQMRVLFAMRSLPVAFVVCANPEPIGLAIKHRYGLDSDTSDYEARRILEKFVDSYEELSEPVGLERLVRAMWQNTKDASLPWMLNVDQKNKKLDIDDVVRNTTGFEAMTTAVPFYSNLRVLQKSFQYVHDRVQTNRHFLWTNWHLEIVAQIDPKFRHDLRLIASYIQEIVYQSYMQLSNVKAEDSSNNNVRFFLVPNDKIGQTLFALFRSFFWEQARSKYHIIASSTEPQIKDHASILRGILANPLRMDFLILLCMWPFTSGPSFKDIAKNRSELYTLRNSLKQEMSDEFGWVLANA